MGDNRLRCPSCAKSVGGLTREGDVRVRLVVTLVKADGTVHGPCAECGTDLIVAQGGAPTVAIAKAFGSPSAKPRRLVLALSDFET